MNREPKFDTKKDLKKALDAIDTTIDQASPEGVFPQLPIIATYFATLSQVKEDDEQHYVREPPSTYDLGRSGIFSLAPGGVEAHEGDIILTMREDANRYVYDEADARTFLLKLIQDVISDNGFMQHHDSHDVNHLDDEDEDEQDDPFLSFTPVGEPDIPRLMADLENGDAETRSQAVVALAMSGERTAVEPLLATLKTHSNPQVRLGAIQALWRLGDMRALEPLIATLKGDEDSYVRRVTAYALGQLGDQRAIEPLIAAFSDEIKGVGFTASLALAELGASATRPLLALLYQGDEHSDS